MLIGWALDLPLLRAGLPGSLSVKANSAVGFLAAGLSARTLASRRSGPRARRVAKIAGLVVASVGFFTLVEYVASVNLGIDQLLVKEPPGAAGTTYPGRMAPNSALAFLFIGIALAVHDLETEAGTRPAQLLALAAALVPLQAIIGFAYGVEPMEGLAANTRVPFYAGIGFLLLVTSLLFDRPRSGLMGVFTGPGLAGFMARRLIGAVFVVPIGLGWLFLVVGLRAGKYEALLGASFVVVSAVVVAAAVVYWNALALGDMEGERLRAEETEAKQREWLRTTLASIGDAVIATDVDGVVTLVNAVAEKLTGAGSQAVGRPLGEVFRAVDESRRPIPDPVAAALARGGPAPLGPGVTLLAFTGAEYPVEGSAAPIRAEGGQPQGVALIFGDRTEERRGEAERAALLAREQEARAEAERASRTKDEFIATVSHELRTPLNAVLGWARLLRTGRLDAEATVRAMEAIERSAMTQAQIVDDLLDVARIVRGRLKLDVRDVDLSVAVEAAADTVGPAANAKGIAVALQLEPGAGLVRGDPGRLQQVVWNLLANAIKFTPPGGRVEVRLSRLPDRVRLQVEDDGAGIDPGSSRTSSSASARAIRARPAPMAASASASPSCATSSRPTAAALPPPAGEETRARASRWTCRSPSISRAPSPGRRGVRGPASRQASPRVKAFPACTSWSWTTTPIPWRRFATCSSRPAPGSRPPPRRRTPSRPCLASRPTCSSPTSGCPARTGSPLIRRIRELDPARGGGVPAAALTAYTQASDRDRALGAGFQAFLAKPVDPRELADSVARLAGRPQ